MHADCCQFNEAASGFLTEQPNSAARDNPGRPLRWMRHAPIPCGGTAPLLLRLAHCIGHEIYCPWHSLPSDGLA